MVAKKVVTKKPAAVKKSVVPKVESRPPKVVEAPKEMEAAEETIQLTKPPENIPSPVHPDAEKVALALLGRLSATQTTVLQVELDNMRDRKLVVQQLSSSETRIAME